MAAIEEFLADCERRMDGSIEHTRTGSSLLQHYLALAEKNFREPGGGMTSPGAEWITHLLEQARVEFTAARAALRLS